MSEYGSKNQRIGSSFSHGAAAGFTAAQAYLAALGEHYERYASSRQTPSRPENKMSYRALVNAGRLAPHPREYALFTDKQYAEPVLRSHPFLTSWYSTGFQR